MTQKIRSVVIIGVLVLVVMLKGRAGVATTGELYIVTFSELLNLQTQEGDLAARSIVWATGSAVKYNLWISNALLIKPPLINPARALDQLRANELVLDVLKDVITVVDPVFPAPAAPLVERRDWGVERINGRSANAISTGDGVKVAILDTGINSNHSDLDVYDGFNVFTDMEGGRDTEDPHGHGSHMAGIIAAKYNNKGLVGIAPGASLYALKCLDQLGSARLSDVLKCMQHILSTDIRLLLMSIQFSRDYKPLRAATQRLIENNVLIVAAAGNRCSSGPPDEGGGDDAGECDPTLSNDVAFPARYPSVIPAGAIDWSNNVTGYSRSGSAMATSGLVAPGGSHATGIYILSTGPNPNKDEFTLGSGTSQAAAHTAGIVALALQLRPDLDVQEAIQYLRRTARDLGEASEKQGAGLADAKEMLDELPK
jgi:subtilisin